MSAAIFNTQVQYMAAERQPGEVEAKVGEGGQGMLILLRVDNGPMLSGAA